MQLTKLRAAPVLQAEVPPCAPAGQMDGGTASQLIRGVGPTMGSGTMHPYRQSPSWLLGVVVKVVVGIPCLMPVRGGMAT